MLSWIRRWQLKNLGSWQGAVDCALVQLDLLRVMRASVEKTFPMAEIIVVSIV